MFWELCLRSVGGQSVAKTAVLIVQKRLTTLLYNLFFVIRFCYDCLLLHHSFDFLLLDSVWLLVITFCNNFSLGRKKLYRKIALNWALLLINKNNFTAVKMISLI